MEIKISASIVLYNSDPTVRQAIQSFLATELPIKLFLIDNSPTNFSKDRLSDLISDPRVEYVFNNRNLGYGSAHNIAIRRSLSLSKYHLVLNPDIFFERGVLENLYNYAERNKDVGLLMPKVVYPDGNVQYICKLLPTPIDLFFRRFLPASFTRKRLNIFEMRTTGYDKEMEVPYLSGCFMFLRVKALEKVGLFDERFFMYPEDIDITRRIHANYKTLYYPHVKVVHAHARESYTSVKLLYVHIVNMIKYFNKWGWFFDKDRRIINKRILSQFE